MDHKRGWSASDIPDLSGASAVVTGANSGIGYETALQLAAHGAVVVLACRSEEKGAAAAERIADAAPGATVSVVTLDLSSLASVRAAAEQLRGSHDRLNVLVNNAGVMGTPYLFTEDGFELQLATNHFGHFALTGLVLPLLLRAPGSRVVTVSSMLHRMARFDLADLQSERRYIRWRAYANSKLANLLFTYEFQRRLEATGASTLAVAAHPGWARSNLAANGPVIDGSALRARAGSFAGRHLGQSAAAGALPTLYAATAADVHGGELFGPSRLFQQVGPPVRVGSSTASHRADVAAELWAASENLTGVHYGLGAPVAGSGPST